MKLNIRSLAGISAVLLVGALPVLADTVTYDFGSVSSGGTPAGKDPWVQATFTDAGMPAGTVQLTLNAGNLSGSEFVSGWYFNLNPGLDPTALTFTSSGSSGSFTAPAISTGTDGFKAGPDGKFDVLFGFSTANSGQFTSGDSMTLDISGIGGLTANDFNWLSTCAGGNGLYSSAAHIQSIDGSDSSAWVNPTSTLLQNESLDRPVPDNSTTIMLLGASLLVIEVMRRKLRIQAA
jgi:hypothetical protein